MDWSPPHFSHLVLASLTAASLVCIPTLSSAQEQNETLIEIKAVAGMRYDLPRIKVAPGAKVRLRLENVDDMAHNLVITAPGARVEVANAAMMMPLTPTQDFVPKTDKVLHAIPVLTPGKKAELTFTAPEKEDVYPYVCTYPGHGMVMFGAMYVTRKELPPLEIDPHVPASAKELANPAPFHAFTPTRPYLYRTFLRDSGPASIAVALPGEQNYCWDAGSCRLRYAWRGGFLDPLPHWREKGDGFAEVTGRIYWRAGADFPLRIGARDRVPAAKFRGYRLRDRYPEFHYELDGVEVRELIKPPHHGSGLAVTLTIAAANSPVFYVTDPEGGATFTSDVGAFDKGVLVLTAGQARAFTVTLTEVPGREPIGYWSMDDVLSVKKPFPVPGVRGRAVTFDGKKAEFATGLNTDALAAGATFVMWVRAKAAPVKRQVVLGARGESGEFALGWNLVAPGTFGLRIGSEPAKAEIMATQQSDADWHFVAVVFDGKQASMFHDGQKIGAVGATLPGNSQIFLGSIGGRDFAAATLDDVRIYDRLLSETEIGSLYNTARMQAVPTLDR
ncbi:MAG TPA: LamG-like jellyroll fold domain-containing protein [Chthoniobacteraceae bacterium]|nr:LamG-like jellyroll fold domain-containing protein [Chthoniobacteraceae bacterium]